MRPVNQKKEKAKKKRKEKKGNEKKKNIRKEKKHNRNVRVLHGQEQSLEREGGQ